MAECVFEGSIQIMNGNIREGPPHNFAHSPPNIGNIPIVKRFATQVDVLGAAHRGCCHCGRNQRVKDLRTRTFRTVFGTVQVSCRRYLRCNCQGGTRATVWPLHRQQLSGTSPELQYLYASWGSKVSYRRAAAVLDELLPISDRGVSHATLRRHTLAIGGRLDMRVTEPDEYDWPEPRREPVEPAQSLNVAIDGTYVRADRVMGLAEYHVVAGRIEREGRLGGYFAWVAAHPMCDAEAFMKAALDDHGLTQTSRVRVLADGADSLSFWKLSDKPPYFELIHSTQSKKSAGGIIASMKQRFYRQEAKNVTKH